MKTTTALLLIFTSAAYAMEQKEVGQAWDAQHYQQNSDSQLQAGIRLVKKIENIEKLESMLDVGCGTGRLAGWLLEQAPNCHIIGIDYSEDMIKKAQELHQDADSTRLTFLQADAQDFDLKKTFQLIISAAVFHFLQNHQGALNCIARSLEPNGNFLMTMAAKSEQSPILQALFKTFEDEIWAPYKALHKNALKTLTKDELEEKIKVAGLEVVSVEEYIRTIPFVNREKFTEYILGWVRGIEGLERMDAQQQRSLVEAIVQHYLELKPADEDGSIVYYLPALLAHAKKPAGDNPRIFIEFSEELTH